jgi:histidinol-phosphate aminotransferase
VTRNELAKFVDRVPSSALILVDEAYFEFAEDPNYGTAIALIPQHPNVIVSRTF